MTAMPAPAAAYRDRAPALNLNSSVLRVIRGQQLLCNYVGKQVTVTYCG